MIIDAQYDLHLIVPIDDDIYIVMATLAGDSIVPSDNERFYDADSFMNLEIIEDIYLRAGFNFWKDINVIDANNGNQYLWHLASPHQLTREQIVNIILEFEDTRNNRSSLS